MITTCNRCGQTYEHNDSWMGQTLSCKGCNGEVVFPPKPTVTNLLRTPMKFDTTKVILVAVICSAVIFGTMAMFSKPDPERENESVRRYFAEKEAQEKAEELIQLTKEYQALKEAQRLRSMGITPVVIINK